MRYLFIFLFIILFAFCSKSNSHEKTNFPAIYQPQDSVIISEKLKNIKYSKNVSKIKVLTQIARSFIGTPYVSGTLDIYYNESLIINARELDCLTLVETCVALTNTMFSEEKTFGNYKNQLVNIRYRNGIIEGYTSRIHYFSEWISENEKNGIFDDITSENGGLPFPIKVNFMSTNPSSYKQLKADSSLIPEISDMEKRISSIDHYYIPKEKVVEIENKLKEGMIVGITSNISGLDISHTGILVKQNDRIHLLHASSDIKKVIISDLPLADYLTVNKRLTGIIIMKLK